MNGYFLLFVHASVPAPLSGCVYITLAYQSLHTPNNENYSVQDGGTQTWGEDLKHHSSYPL